MVDEPESSGPKRVHMTMRLAPSLRSRLEQSANENGRSLTQEVENRLSQSFDMSEAINKAVSAAFEYTLGGKSAQTVALMFATTVRVVESREGKSFDESSLVSLLVVESIRRILSKLFCSQDDKKDQLSGKSKEQLEEEAIFISNLVLALLKKENLEISRQMEEFFSKPHHK